MKVSKQLNRNYLKKNWKSKKKGKGMIYKKCKCVHSGCNEDKILLEMSSEELFMVND